MKWKTALASMMSLLVASDLWAEPLVHSQVERNFLVKTFLMMVALFAVWRLLPAVRFTFRILKEMVTGDVRQIRR